MTTYEKIYKALKDKNFNKFNVGNQFFEIEREDLGFAYRFNLNRCYFSGTQFTQSKIWIKSFTVRDNALPFNYKKCIREFLEQIYTSLTWHLTPALNKYCDRSVRKANFFYPWKNRWDTVSDICETYDKNGVFCGWRKKTYLTW